MTKTIPTVLVLALTCLLTLSAALPSAPSQSVSVQTTPNVPRMLLGKPYRQRRDSQGPSPSRWTLTITDRNDADHRANPGHASAHGTQIGSSDWTQTKMNTKPLVPIPLPLVLNTLSGSGQARLRLMKPKRPMQYNRHMDNTPPSKRVHPDGINSRDEAEQLQSPDLSKLERRPGLREASVPVRRSKRLYDRGEWKSRLFEEY